MRWRFALAMARREGRAARRRLVLYGACVAFGIAGLVGLHGLRASVEREIAAESKRLLGADLRLASRAAFGADAEQRVAELAGQGGSPPARVVRFGSMALVPRSGRTRLADVQAVSGGYPFYGAVETDPPGVWEALQGEGHVALVDASLLVQLEARIGDELALGDARFRIAGTVGRAPGSFTGRTQLAPRVFVAGRHLPETGLLRQGSMVDHLVFVAGPEAEIERWLERHRSPLEAARVRIQTAQGHQEELSRTTAMLTRYLGLVGLAALSLGAIGVAAGVRVLVREKLDAVAVLRSLGARSSEVFAAYGLLALALGAAAGGFGAVLGAIVQFSLPGLVGGWLPVEVENRVEPTAIATGIGLGLWVTALFSLAPLLDLRRVPPLRGLRRDFGGEPEAHPGRVSLWLALAATLLAAGWWQAPDLRVGLVFAGGLAGTLAVLAAAAAGVTRWLRARRLRRAPWWLRQGISNLFRPRNHTLATTLAVGFGLYLVSTLHAVQYNVMRQLAFDSRPDRPNLVMFDVQPDQQEPLEAFLAERGAKVAERAPLISARIAAIRGRNASEWLGEGDLDSEFRWALRREYQVTVADVLRPTEEVVEGSWWSGAAVAPGAPSPVSLEVDIAESLGVGVGDALAWDIQGVRVDSVVASLREVEWGRLATNFFAVFPPDALEGAPRTTVLLARVADPEARAVLQRDLVEKFPNVAALDATAILSALDAMRRNLGFAVRLLAGFCLVTGLVILLAAAAAARSERTRDALLLRTLGASSRAVRRVVATEAAALGVIAVAVGSGLAAASAWGLVRFVFDLPFDPPVGALAGLAAATWLVCAAAGAAGGPPRRRGALAALREAECGGAAPD
jgi:putative ABC transport system permease protein